MGGSVAKLYKEMLNVSRLVRFSAMGRLIWAGAMRW
jgi:hypothetical protein